MSKSQVAISFKNIKKPLETGDSYSNEQFESMAESKTLSGDDRITCFMCKQVIPKSQALTHHQICKKMQDEGRLGKKYSPIRETEDEN